MLSPSPLVSNIVCEEIVFWTCSSLLASRDIVQDLVVTVDREFCGIRVVISLASNDGHLEQGYVFFEDEVAAQLQFD